MQKSKVDMCSHFPYVPKAPLAWSMAPQDAFRYALFARDISGQGLECSSFQAYTT